MARAVALVAACLGLLAGAAGSYGLRAHMASDVVKRRAARPEDPGIARVRALGPRYDPMAFRLRGIVGPGGRVDSFQTGAYVGRQLPDRLVSMKARPTGRDSLDSRPWKEATERLWSYEDAVLQAERRVVELQDVIVGEEPEAPAIDIVGFVVDAEGRLHLQRRGQSPDLDAAFEALARAEDARATFLAELDKLGPVGK